ncbi:MAG: 5 protein [Actinomycetota bacterium]|nr:5 protein [Actinomycetota bacterium]
MKPTPFDLSLLTGVWIRPVGRRVPSKKQRRTSTACRYVPRARVSLQVPPADPLGVQQTRQEQDTVLGQIQDGFVCDTFFSRAAGDPRVVGLALAGAVIEALVPDGADVPVAVDDTRLRRRGKKVWAALWTP